MLKKKISISLIVLAFGLFSCGKDLDLNIGNSFKGQWVLYQSCNNLGCTDADPDVEVVLEFGDKNVTKRDNGEVVAGGSYIIRQVNNDSQKAETIYVLIVNERNWELSVTDTTLDLLVERSFGRYNKVR